MNRRDSSLWIALIGSLVLHAAMASFALYGLRGWSVETRRVVAITGPVYVEREPDRADRMGENLGTGLAVNSAEGEWPQLAREGGQDQAALSRDAEGLGALMSWPTENRGGGARLSTIAEAEARFGVATAETELIGPAVRRQRPGATRPSKEQTSGANAGQAGAAAAADPYPQSESESDPFAKEGSATVRNGRLEARFGRRVKTVRVRLNAPEELDVLTYRFPRVQLRVKTDETGKVTRVDILESSGSVTLDSATRLAMYEWWIEPPVNQAGKAIADVMTWTITFR